MGEKEGNRKKGVEVGIARTPPIDTEKKKKKKKNKGLHSTRYFTSGGWYLQIGPIPPKRLRPVRLSPLIDHRRAGAGALRRHFPPHRSLLLALVLLGLPGARSPASKADLTR